MSAKCWDLLNAIYTNYIHEPEDAEQAHDLDWHKLGARVSGLFKTPPGATTMLCIDVRSSVRVLRGAGRQ